MSKPVNTIHRLRLSKAELEKLAKLVELDEGDFDEQRAAERRGVNRPAVLIQGKPDEVESKHEVYVRNISRNGAAVLHTAFLPSQLDCFLVMVTQQRVPITIPITVVRCHHIAGHMHDVGLRFFTQLTEEQAADLAILPAELGASAGPNASLPLREALTRCRTLAGQIHNMVESGASPEQVLPLLDELRNIEPGTDAAA